MVPLALVICAAVYVSPLVASDVRHRADSTLDQLTGLLNRRALGPRFAEIAEQAALTDQPVSVVLADLDHFKSINDDHGHGVGDAVLRDVAYAMRRALRTFELLYRLGGEEFALLLPGAAEDDAVRIAESLRVAIEELEIGGLRVTCSFGVATARGEDIALERLVAGADAALYAAKRGGRNRVERHDDALPSPSPDACRLRAVQRRRGTRRSVVLAIAVLVRRWRSRRVRAGQGRRAGLRQARRLWRRAGLAASGPLGGRQVQRLVLRVNGVVADAPIKPLATVPGIDLGPGTVPGSVVAVYTRCTGGLFHERCSIYELDIASGRERRVSALATRRASISNPSVWAGRYAFGRIAIEGRERAGRNFGLYTGIGRAHRLGSRRPGSTDVDANVVAYQTGGPSIAATPYEIRVRRLRGRADCLIAKRTEKFSVPRNDNTVSTPVLSGGYVYWSLSGSLGTSPVRIMRVPIPGPDCKLGQVERGTVDIQPVSGALPSTAPRPTTTTRPASSRPTCRPSHRPSAGSGSARRGRGPASSRRASSRRGSACAGPARARGGTGSRGSRRGRSRCAADAIAAAISQRVRRTDAAICAGRRGPRARCGPTCSMPIAV